MIRVLIVDDHPALRAGLDTVLGAAHDIVGVGTASSEFELWPALDRTEPDVVLLDYHLPRNDGLVLCHRVKARLVAPRVLIYTAYADPSLTLPALVAGADAIVPKSASARELLDAIRAVARGEELLSAPSVEQLRDAAARLDPEDRPIVPLVLDRTPPRQIGETLGIDERRLADRVARIIARLRVDVPDSAG